MRLRVLLPVLIINAVFYGVVGFILWDSLWIFNAGSLATGERVMITISALAVSVVSAIAAEN